MFDRLERSQSASPTATRHIGPFEAGQHVGLSDLRGDLDVARESFAESAGVVRYDVAGTGERGIVHVRYRTVGPVDDLLTIPYENDIVLERPIEHLQGGTDSIIRFTIVGTGVGIERAAANVPTEVDLSLERIGQYESGGDASPVLADKRSTLHDDPLRYG